jgi:hypothetical protein
VAALLLVSHWGGGGGIGRYKRVFLSHVREDSGDTKGFRLGLFMNGALFALGLFSPENETRVTMVSALNSKGLGFSGPTFH